MNTQPISQTDLTGWVFVYKLSDCVFESPCYHFYEPCLIPDIIIIIFFAVSVFFFKSLRNGEFPHLLILAAFSNKSFSSKTS